MGKIVAVTGEGVNDIESLYQANVGLAMGSGCSAAK
jgi:P-type E1-E2 ATPase